MKSKDQQMLEEAYQSIQQNQKPIEIKQDEISFYVEKKGMSGKILKDRTYSLYDSKGGPLGGKTPLEDGQILFYRTIGDNTFGKYFEVKKTEQGIFGHSFTPSKEVQDAIVADKKGLHSKGEEKMSKHFFPKS